MRYMSNPRVFTLKKWLYNLLNKDFPTHEPVVERVATSLVTDDDMEKFGKFIGGIYQAGYMKALNDYKGQLEEMGIKIKITPPEKVNL